MSALLVVLKAALLIEGVCGRWVRQLDVQLVRKRVGSGTSDAASARVTQARPSLDAGRKPAWSGARRWGVPRARLRHTSWNE